MDQSKYAFPKTQINIFPNTNDGSLWKTTKSILDVKEKFTHLKGPNGQLAISDKDKADFF